MTRNSILKRSLFNLCCKFFLFHLLRHHYQQTGALRAGSPYSLPITSGSMPRFSPGGLLGHHPGLSPASAGQGGHSHHLPHIKQDLDAVSSGNHHHGSSHSGRAEKECKCATLTFLFSNGSYQIDANLANF